MNLHGLKGKSKSLTSLLKAELKKPIKQPLGVLTLVKLQCEGKIERLTRAKKNCLRQIRKLRLEKDGRK